jgi:PhnB protein
MAETTQTKQSHCGGEGDCATPELAPQKNKDSKGGENNNHNQTAMIMVRVRDAGTAVDFYTKALQAKVLKKHCLDDGRVIYAHLYSPLGTGFAFGVEGENAIEEAPEHSNVRAPSGDATHASGMYAHLCLMGKGSCDRETERMRDAGGTITMEPTDTCYGARLAKCYDPFGIAWDLAEWSRRPEEIFEVDQGTHA